MLYQGFDIRAPLDWGDVLSVTAYAQYNNGSNKTNECKRIDYLNHKQDSVYSYLVNENVDTKSYDFNVNATIDSTSLTAWVWR